MNIIINHIFLSGRNLQQNRNLHKKGIKIYLIKLGIKIKINRNPDENGAL
ncbi:hypothetical protein DR85_1719 [Francisella tularensis]|nr:hypothetical protein DR85_1719 [Francisella tularensis]